MRGESGLGLNPEGPGGKPGEDGGTEPRGEGASGREAADSVTAAGSSGTRWGHCHSHW